MEDVNVSNVREVDEMVRMRELTCVRRSRSLRRERIVRVMMLLSRERKIVMRRERRNQFFL
jgi:hypothetical protein